MLVMLRKPATPETPITEDSLVLLRLGERCDQACLMCPNTRAPDRLDLSTAEAVRRVEHVAALGFRRAVLSGGEPSLHEGFSEVTARLAANGISWDIVTNGGCFSMADMVSTAVACGLTRAVVSLHSHDPDVDAVITGTRRERFRKRIQAIHLLDSAGVEVVVNRVLLPHTRIASRDFIRFCASELGTRVRVKVAFPLFDLHQRDSTAFRLTYSECAPAIRAMREEALDTGLDLLFESIPNCIHGDPLARNCGRLGFGETHYLDDLHGNRVYSIAVIEAMTSVFGEPCTRCVAFDRCPGVHIRYTERFGMPEMVPFADPSVPWWAVDTLRTPEDAQRG